MPANFLWNQDEWQDIQIWMETSPYVIGGNNQESQSSNGTSVVCKHCKSKVTNGVKCILCESIFHPSCSKLVWDVIVLNDNTIKCCEKVNGNDSNWSENIEMMLCDALKEYVHENNKTDIKLVKYILNQKRVIIQELKGILHGAYLFAPLQRLWSLGI